jgi:hypothetical protein
MPVWLNRISEGFSKMTNTPGQLSAYGALPVPGGIMRFAIIIAICISMLASGAITDAQPVVPNDLIFTTSTDSINADCLAQFKSHLQAVEIYYARLPCYRNALAWLDGATMTASVWYTVPEIFDVRALEWSPDGNMLAIYQQKAVSDNPDENMAEICLLNRSGQIMECMDERPAPVYTSPYYIDTATITWSPDSTRLYFMVYTDLPDVVNTMQEYRLVEADAVTGQTLRTVYQYQLTIEDLPEYEVQHLLLSPGLTHVFVNAGIAIDGGRHLLVNLYTGQNWSLEQIDLPENWTRRMTYGIEPCFSPDGRSLALSVNVMDEARQVAVERRIIIFSVDGRQKYVSPVDVKGWFLDWSADNRSVILIDENGQIYRYDFIDNTLIRLAKYNDAFLNPFIRASISPNNLFFVQDDSLENEQIRVFDLDGQIYDIKEPFLYAMLPLWIPDASS